MVASFDSFGREIVTGTWSPPDAPAVGVNGGVPRVSGSEYAQTSPLTVLTGPNVVTVARRFLTEVLSRSGVGLDAQDDAEVLIGEVVGNFLRHERAPAVTLDATVDEYHQVTVTVLGAAHDASDRLVHPATHVPPISENGRGLGILDSLALAWGTRRQYRRTAVWFTVRDLAPRTGFHRSTRGITAIGTVADTVVTEALDIAAATEDDLSAVPEVVEFRAAIIAQGAAVEAAARTAHDAETARVAKSIQAGSAASAIADIAAQAVVAAKVEADAAAEGVAAAAELAAATVAAAVEVGDVGAAAVADRIAATVISAAAETADQTARTAVLIAHAVAAAATAVAKTTAVDAEAAAQVVLLTAQAVQAVAAAAAQRLAADTAERESLAALVDREASSRLSELRQNNLLLQQAGHHDRAVANALQQAMRTRLPELPQVSLAARYLTASRGDQVGGDWYDALSLAGQTSLIIGDVVGHDIAAAAVMGQLRNLLRALIWNDNDAPSKVVSRLDRAAHDLKIDTLATLVVVTVDAAPADPADRSTTFRWTNAGHPPPILVNTDGSVEILGGSSNLLLGVEPATKRHDTTRVVPPGTMLLLYTDGLVETRIDDVDTRIAQLIESLQRHRHLDLGPLLDGVVADMIGTEPDDDVALLAALFR